MEIIQPRNISNIIFKNKINIKKKIAYTDILLIGESL